MINGVMSKTTDRTKRFVRFLIERGIKYIYTEETLLNAYRKYESRQFNLLLSDGVNGNLLKYFDSFFSITPFGIIPYSFSWINSKKGYDFWAKMEREWVKNKYKQMYIND